MTKKTTPPEDQLELELVPDNVKSFTGKRQRSAEDNMTSQEFLDMGVEAFTNELDGATGFLALIFDEDSNPRVLWAGDINMIAAVGALEVAKNELFKNIIPADM